MPHDAQQYYSQQFEHIIATVFTCRSIIKYNLTLSPEQKEELFKDIDTSLEALRSYVITPLTSISESAPSNSQVVQPDVPVSSETDALSSKAALSSSEKQIMQSLYEMYHAYMNEKQSPNITTFMNRFNEVMSAMNEIQQSIRSISASSTQQEPIAHSLEHMRIFISDLYAIFTKFIRMLSEILQQKNENLNTDELSSSYAIAPRVEFQEVQQERKDAERDLTLLLQAYTAHQQLDRLKGDLVARVREVTTFLNFLKQDIATTSGREELIVRLNYATTLLDEMSRLLAEYEKAASTLL